MGNLLSGFGYKAATNLNQFDAADDEARARLDEIRARRRGEVVVRAPETQPYRTWLDRFWNLLR